MVRSWRRHKGRGRRSVAAALILFALTTLSVLGFTAGNSLAAYGDGYDGYCYGGYGYGGGYQCPPLPPHVAVIKHVINDDGGSADAADFTMTITGVTAVGGNSFPGEEAPGTDKVVTAGSYNVTETGPAGYDASFTADCTATIAAGQAKTCTVRNDDVPAHLIVIKHVINNDTGTKTASDFTMTINGVTVPSGASFPGAESPGTNKVVHPGSYSVSETGGSGYFTTFSADCTGSIALGQTKTCTVTNNDLGPRRTAGYWKTHEVATTPMLPQALGSYSVTTFPQALAVFNAMNCGNAQPGSVVGCLAGQLLTTKLNLANGNSACIQPTVSKADAFLSGGMVTVGGVTVTGVTYTGPGNYTLTTAQRTVAVALADALDAYNNNKKGCKNP